MRTVSRFFLLAFLVLIGECLAAQTKAPYKLSATGHYGFLISHHGTMQYLVKAHIGGFELSYLQPTYGEKEWQRVFNYPEWGISYLHYELGNPDVLGNLHGMFGFINFPSGKKKRANFRLGLGMAYMTKRFDPVKNHKDIAIGSHLNGLINLGFNRHFRLSEHLQLEAGIYLTHASNGSSKVPNLGINMPTINLGLAYSFADNSRQRITDTLSPVEKKPGYSILANAGFTQIEPVEGPSFFVTELTGNVSWPWSHAWHGVTGIDLMYNHANLEKLHRDTADISSDLQNVQVGIKAGGELIIGKLSMPLEMGGYVYTRMTRNGYFYHRLGVRYSINEHWFVNFTMKTHFAKADYLAWGAGYRI